MAESHTPKVVGTVPKEIVEIAEDMNAEYVSESQCIDRQYHIRVSDLHSDSSIAGRSTNAVDIVQVGFFNGGVSVSVTLSD